MADERLRELERRWRQTGALDDELAWLSERLRVGDLDRRRLELAVWCGHAAAQRLGERAAPDGLEAWLDGLPWCSPSDEEEPQDDEEAERAQPWWITEAVGEQAARWLVGFFAERWAAIDPTSPLPGRARELAPRLPTSQRGVQRAAIDLLEELERVAGPVAGLAEGLREAFRELGGEPYVELQPGEGAEAALRRAAGLAGVDVRGALGAVLAEWALGLGPAGADASQAPPRSGPTDPGVEPAALRARLRSGDLHQDHLRLAATLGHPAAREVHGGALPPPPRTLEALLAVLAEWGQELQVRAAVAAARHLLDVDGPRSPRVRAQLDRALSAAEAWAECPCEAHRDAATQAGADVMHLTRWQAPGLIGRWIGRTHPPHVQAAIRELVGSIGADGEDACGLACAALIARALR